MEKFYLDKRQAIFFIYFNCPKISKQQKEISVFFFKHLRSQMCLKNDSVLKGTVSQKILLA